ncbi:hypothetical protein GYMLUDRAFT_88239 [Collybiopsis luxurians FD-317 M1]|uniref:Metallo-beta-lactamase domain-containing protein n=1 Tax=Collybiopsis luxurians FD-317 M1 TaxID=944289 RepID=A0A0D0AU95_9AGAR|nr:hypothetical protein GYMLUDRAFT_88239 [Collybiopsis luxurians FD-317 M1]
MSQVTLPKSTSTVSVKVLNVSTPTSTAPSSFFISPVKPGRERLSVVVHTFLIEHPNGRKMMFDLGGLKDPGQYSPAVKGLLSSQNFDMSVDADVTEQLNAGGIRLDQIDTVIWSHTHPDHVGDMSLFPPTTKLLIGKGTDRKVFPEFPDAQLRESDFAGREVEELSWETAHLTIAGLRAFDFFGDGSFYVLDTPGHCSGHLSALARVKEDSFVLLGGDVCHHPGQLRPNLHIQRNIPYSGDILIDLSQPILTVPGQPSAYGDKPTALATLEKIQLLDAHPDIFVILAHDSTLEGIINLFPETVNNWKEFGWKHKAVWAFMQEGTKGFGYH